MSRLGQVYNSLGKFAEALELLTGSARLQQELGQVREEAVSLGLLSSVNARLGRYQESAVYQINSLSRLEQNNYDVHVTQRQLTFSFD